MNGRSGKQRRKQRTAWRPACCFCTTTTTTTMMMITTTTAATTEPPIVAALTLSLCAWSTTKPWLVVAAVSIASGTVDAGGVVCAVVTASVDEAVSVVSAVSLAVGCVVAVSGDGTAVKLLVSGLVGIVAGGMVDDNVEMGNSEVVLSTAIWVVIVVAAAAAAVVVVVVVVVTVVVTSVAIVVGTFVVACVVGVETPVVAVAVVGIALAALAFTVAVVVVDVEVGRSQVRVTHFAVLVLLPASSEGLAVMAAVDAKTAALVPLSASAAVVVVVVVVVLVVDVSDVKCVWPTIGMVVCRASSAVVTFATAEVVAIAVARRLVDDGLSPSAVVAGAAVEKEVSGHGSSLYTHTPSSGQYSPSAVTGLDSLHGSSGSSGGHRLSSYLSRANQKSRAYKMQRAAAEYFATQGNSSTVHLLTANRAGRRAMYFADCFSNTSVQSYARVVRVLAPHRLRALWERVPSLQERHTHCA